MSYVIVKGNSNKALNDFECNGLPIKRNATLEQMKTNPQECYSDRLFHFYKDCASSFRTKEEAECHIAVIKQAIENNRSRYEQYVPGSTDKMLHFADKLHVIDIKDSNWGDNKN